LPIIGTQADTPESSSQSLRSVLGACISAVAGLRWEPLAPLIVLVALFHATAAAILLANGLPVAYTPAGLADVVVMFTFGTVAGACYILGPQIICDLNRQLRGLRPTPFHERLSDLAKLLVSGWVLAMIFALALLAKSNLKPAITVINPTTYDVQLESIERTIFGGTLPTEWLIAHSSNTAIRLWDFIYGMFGMFLFVSMMIALHHDGIRGGARLVFSLVAGLFLTLIISLAWPTLGPLFVHSDWFGPLGGTVTDRLAHNLSYTVRAYAANPGVRHHVIAGISAMPSFHVIAWTCGLLCWRSLPRPIFALGVVLVVLNWISTVVLGWHYALDGLVGIVLAVLIFRLACWVIPSERQPDGNDLEISR